MSNERINSVICKMHEGKYDFIARCLSMACESQHPSSRGPSPAPGRFTRSVPVTLLLEQAVLCPSRNFALTVAFIWKVPPVSLCMAASFSLLSFSSGLNLGRGAFLLQYISISKVVPAPFPSEGQHTCHSFTC